MGMTREQFEQHPIHATIGSMQPRVDAAYAQLKADNEAEAANANYALEIEQLHAISKLYKESLDQVDVSLVDVNVINNMAQFISNILNSHIPENSTLNLGNLQSLNSQLMRFNNTGNPLDWIFALRTLASPSKNISALKKAEQDAIKIMQSIGGINEEHNKRIANLENEIQQAHNKVSEANKLLGISIEEVRKTASDDRNDRTKEYQEWFADFGNAKEEEMKIKMEAAFKRLGELEQKSKGRADAIRELYELAAGNAVAGSYIQTAESERKSAKNWSIATVVAVVFALGFGVFSLLISLFSGNENANSWIFIFKNFSVIGLFLLGIGFCNSRAKAHQANAQKAQWTGLQVQTIDPYIQSLTPEEQRKFKADIGKDLFGREQVRGNSEKSKDKEQVDGAMILSELRNLASKFGRNAPEGN